MNTTGKRPELRFVSRDEARVITDNGVKWYAGVADATTGCTEFSFGTATLDSGAGAALTPELEFTTTNSETGGIITGGKATVTVDGERHTLRPFDAVFIPPGAEYTFENTRDDPVTFIWARADDEKTGNIPEKQIHDHGGQVQVIQTVRDLEPAVTLNEGHSKRYWVPICPEVTGARSMGMGIIQRPLGSVAPLHEHNPPTLTEAFTVADGRMLVTDQDGQEFVLDRNDFLYVPEYGMHTNKNIGTGEMTYAFVECPARSRERIAEMEQNWYDDS